MLFELAGEVGAVGETECSQDAGEVVGDYQAGAGTRGFTWTSARGFAIVDGPGGAVSTAITGVNDAGDLVGYYTDRAGHTDGLVATPAG